MPAARHQGRGAPCGESFWHWALGADGGHGHAQPPFRSSRLIGAERQPTSDCRQSLQQSPSALWVECVAAAARLVRPGIKTGLLAHASGNNCVTCGSAYSVGSRVLAVTKTVTWRSFRSWRSLLFAVHALAHDVGLGARLDLVDEAFAFLRFEQGGHEAADRFDHGGVLLQHGL